MAKKIKDLIAALRKSQTTSADLARALDAAREEAVAIEAEMEAAKSAYSAGLLDLDAGQLQALTARRQAAEVERDRVRHLITSLAARVEETRMAEEEAAFEAERAAADAEAERVAQLIRTRYPKLAKELVDMMRQISAADREVTAINKRLIERNEARRLIDVQARALPQPTSHHATAPSIWSGTVLQAIEGFAPGWDVLPHNASSL